MADLMSSLDPDNSSTSLLTLPYALREEIYLYLLYAADDIPKRPSNLTWTSDECDEKAGHVDIVTIRSGTCPLLNVLLSCQTIHRECTALIARERQKDSHSTQPSDVPHRHIADVLVAYEQAIRLTWLTPAWTTRYSSVLEVRFRILGRPQRQEGSLFATRRSLVPTFWLHVLTLLESWLKQGRHLRREHEEADQSSSNASVDTNEDVSADLDPFTRHVPLKMLDLHIDGSQDDQDPELPPSWMLSHEQANETPVPESKSAWLTSNPGLIADECRLMLSILHNCSIHEQQRLLPDLQQIRVTCGEQVELLDLTKPAPHRWEYVAGPRMRPTLSG